MHVILNSMTRLVNLDNVYQQRTSLSQPSVEEREDDISVANHRSCPTRRRGGVSAEVYTEEDAACYVKKVVLTVLCFSEAVNFRKKYNI
jgi:hypothetical protein